MKVAYLHDPGNQDGTIGGAELTMDAFANAAPRGVEFEADGETVIIGNCVTFAPEILGAFKDKRVFRYHHDLARHEHPKVRQWLEENATHIFTSPFHAERYLAHETCQIEDFHIVPPPVDLAAFRPNRETRRKQERQGVCSIATWQNPGKGAHLITETAHRQGITVDVYGTGPFMPYGSSINNGGPVKQEDLPRMLWTYEQFLFLPTAPEPFGRCVVEAWAAGCQVLTNDLVGAKHYIEDEQETLETAAEDFWELIGA